MEVAHRALVLLLLALGNAFGKRPFQVMLGTSGAYPSGGSQESQLSRPCTILPAHLPIFPTGLPAAPSPTLPQLPHALTLSGPSSLADSLISSGFQL